jgi:hypothetical protein
MQEFTRPERDEPQIIIGDAGHIPEVSIGQEMGDEELPVEQPYDEAATGELGVADDLTGKPTDISDSDPDSTGTAATAPGFYSDGAHVSLGWVSFGGDLIDTGDPEDVGGYSEEIAAEFEEDRLSAALGGGGDSTLDGLIEFEDILEGDEIDRADTPESFEPYRAQYETTDAQLAAGADPESINGYVTRGGMSYVFRTPDGKLLKMPRVEIDESFEGIPEPPAPASIHTDYVEPLERGQGSRHLEQMFTYTEEGAGGVVVETAPGRQYSDLTRAEQDAIPIPHHEGLVDACIDMSARNLWPDIAPDDLMHDTTEGFTVIDYNTLEHAQGDAVANPYATRERTWDAPEMARAMGSRGNLLRTPHTDSHLPQVGRNYYQAYRSRFGDTEAQKLLDEWRRDGITIPDDL